MFNIYITQDDFLLSNRKSILHEAFWYHHLLDRITHMKLIYQAWRMNSVWSRSSLVSRVGLSASKDV